MFQKLERKVVKNFIVNEKKLNSRQLEKYEVEGKFGTGKTRYGLARLFTALKETAECVINMAFFVMNLDKKLRGILCHFINYHFLGMSHGNIGG